MRPFTRRALAVIIPMALLSGGCASAEDGDQAAPSTGAASATEATSSAAASDVAALFVDGALTEDAATLSCTLENGSETTCLQVQMSSLPSTVDTDGPYCPELVGDEGGIWVWDGDDPGLYALDADFWAMMESQGFDFFDEDGAITITDPGAGAADGGGTANSCLEATPDDSYHLQVLLPVEPERLDEPTDLSTISQVGVALDGVTIFGDAPSVADRGGLPALDACGGHIDPSGYYHWHFGADSIQSNLDAASADVTCDVAQDMEGLLGFAYDGYAIFGPEEDGVVPSDLDECGGHVSDTEELGEAYHYHLSTDDPNLPNCRVGATAIDTLTSPDNPSASLPSGNDGGGGGGGERPDGPPPTDG